jgi:transcriptional regulator with XRE-family HTH domain
MSFGELFRQERKRSKKTLGQVAARLQISVTYLSDVERDTRPPLSIERIRDAAQYMEVQDDKLTAMLKAAAAHQGSFPLRVPSTIKGREAGAALMRGWNSLDDDAFERIIEAVGEKGKTSK